ncbi:peptide-methionine (S)-S-oxide reductase MsrA [Thiorhodovibrio frisius]|uniref:Peptide methionine sulfoxide reductase MsrA n=1 Tax=Thiorhodovibrio frisius TaxID=631362 RepID=H8Z0U5_9GAMM|nr:peptide-methionine (S)-S-oxide reductase MsrA [Thiorhodovibrio frisius]EIC21327.1 methionine-S-sulfoxide reductase [Thiorhodovibrio frisius]WPL23910.1 Peptide methionine sulfoxide reductase MsrA [Thiorhodovibrio frisius]
MFPFGKKLELPGPGDALPGRRQPMMIGSQHLVLGTAMRPPFPAGMRQVLFGMGCFWGAEQRFWQLDGVHTTAVGYAGGLTPNPTYEEVCTGLTGHTEVVLVVFDPAHLPFTACLETFWSGHNPTSGMRQGVDIGTQYRSVIFTDGEDHLALARESLAAEQRRLDANSSGTITTEVRAAPPLYYAEDYHQQYAARRLR